MAYEKSESENRHQDLLIQKRQDTTPLFTDHRDATTAQLKHQQLMQTGETQGESAMMNTPSVSPILVATLKRNQLATQNPIQRAKLNMRTNGTISGVSNFPSRPTSNLSGSQGQHLTAYVVFEDTIRGKVKDQTRSGAATSLQSYLDEMLTLPGMQQKNAAYLVDAIDRCKQSLNDADNVEDAIDLILSIRNKVPGTAQRGTGGGHGESGNSGRLEVVESALRNNDWKDSWDEDVVSDQCRYSVWRLLDYNPSEPADEDDRKAIIKVIVTHYKSILSAYPHVNQWLVKRNDYFQTYLEAHRDDSGMPLKQVKPKTLSAIFTDVLKEF